MDALWYVCLIPVVFGIVVAIVRTAQRRSDDTRRKTERASYEERLRAEREGRVEAAVVQLAERYFPFVRPALRDANVRGLDSKDGLRQILSGTEGIELGRASIGLPAILPLAERRKHLIVLGKSGYGKTTIALRMIRDDLEAGRGLCILAAEAEFFRDWVLPLVPHGRASRVIYFKPADPRCPLTWNPLELEEGEDHAYAAGQLFSIFKLAVGEISIGARADAILSSAFGILVGQPGASLMGVARILQDAEYRSAIIETTEDPYLREFWTKTFPEYPAGAVLPLVTRLNQFLRIPQFRAALCHPISSFSITKALEDHVLFLDISGFDPDATALLGRLLLSKVWSKLRERERIPESERRSIHVYADEFHVWADAGWGEWLALGRRYGMGIHAYTQHPNQLPRDLQRDVFGNVSSLIALNLSAADAAVVRRELLIPSSDGSLKPIPAEKLVSLPVGEGFARLASGACALKVKFSEPIPRPDVRLGERVREISWKTYAPPPLISASLPATSEMYTGAETTRTRANGSSLPGRGGARHKLLQRLAREWGEARGFRASVEMEILAGAGHVDVALVRGDVRIAVEVRVSSTAEEVVASLTKVFAADFTTAIVLSVESREQDEILGRLDAKDRARVRFLDPDGLRKYLDELPIPTEADESPVGYRLRIEHEAVSVNGLRARRRTLAQVVGTALLRKRKRSAS